MTIDGRKNAEKKNTGCAVITVLFFLAAAGFALLGFYLRNSLMNFHPAPNEVQEGDMVGALAMMLMFGAAAISLVAALYGLIVFLLRRSRSNKDEAHE